MNKVKIILNYWVMVGVALLTAKIAGFADNNTAIFIILLFVTVGYAAAVIVIIAKGKKAEQKDMRTGRRSTAAETGVKRKKKK